MASPQTFYKPDPEDVSFVGHDRQKSSTMDSDSLSKTTEYLVDIASKDHHGYTKGRQQAIEKGMNPARVGNISVREVAKNASVIMFKWGSPDRPFRCQICDMTFSSGVSLQEHVQKHGPVVKDPKKPFSCDLCLKSYQSKRSLKRHSLSHTGQQQKRCRYCNRAFANKDNLDHHVCLQDESKTYQCPYCDEQFTSSLTLEHHIAGHFGSKEFSCKICSKAFKRKDILERHLITHDSQRKKKHKCVECEKSFQFLFSLKKHVRNMHGNEPDGKKCEVCGTFIKNRENLGRHMLTHSGERPFKCNICKGRFTQKQHLVDHMNTHSNTYLSCDICAAAFRHRRSLKRHKNQHFVIRDSGRIQCSVCLHTACNQEEMLSHYRIYHPLGHICMMCSKKFQNTETLVDHLKDKHNLAVEEKLTMNKATQIDNKVDVQGDVVHTTVGKDMEGQPINPVSEDQEENNTEENYSKTDLYTDGDNNFVSMTTDLVVSPDTIQDKSLVAMDIDDVQNINGKEIIYVVVPSEAEFNAAHSEEINLGSSSNTRQASDQKTCYKVYQVFCSENMKQSDSIPVVELTRPVVYLNTENNTNLKGMVTDCEFSECSGISESDNTGNINCKNVTKTGVADPSPIGKKELMGCEAKTSSDEDQTEINRMALLSSVIDYAVHMQTIETSKSNQQENQ